MGSQMNHFNLTSEGTFTCSFNGNTVIDVKMAAAISTNPYFAFDAVVPEAGEFHFTWYDDDGSIYEEKKSVKIA